MMMGKEDVKIGVKRSSAGGRYGYRQKEESQERFITVVVKE